MNTTNNTTMPIEVQTEIDNVRTCIRYAKPDTIDVTEKLVARSYERFPEINRELQEALQVRRLQIAVVERAVKEVRQATTYEQALLVVERVHRHLRQGEIYVHDQKLMMMMIEEKLESLAGRGRFDAMIEVDVTDALAFEETAYIEAAVPKGHYWEIIKRESRRAPRANKEGVIDLVVVGIRRDQ